jgi:hypothetical protein
MATTSSALRVWTVGDLGAFYTQHRAELLAHASRVLKDSIKAEEITQDALIKFMLAAPELESDESALIPLSTVSQTPYQLGFTMGEQMLAELSADESHLHQHVVFQSQIVERASAKAR